MHAYIRPASNSMFNFCSSLPHTAICHVGSCLVLARQTWPSRKLTSATHSLINFPAIVSHDYSVISLTLNNISCPTKLSIQRVYTCCRSFSLATAIRMVLYHAIIFSSSARVFLEVISVTAITLVSLYTCRSKAIK